METPSHTGGVSEEALKREEERRNKGGRGLKVDFSPVNQLFTFGPFIELLNI